MNDGPETQKSVPNQKAARTNTGPQADRSDQQETVQGLPDVKMAPNQERFGRSGTRAEGTNESAGSNRVDGLNSGENRKFGRSMTESGNSPQNNTNRDGAALDGDGETGDRDSYRFDPNMPNRSDAAKLPTADSKPLIKPNGKATRPDGSRIDRGSSNADQGGHNI